MNWQPSENQSCCIIYINVNNAEIRCIPQYSFPDKGPDAEAYQMLCGVTGVMEVNWMR